MPDRLYGVQELQRALKINSSFTQPYFGPWLEYSVPSVRQANIIQYYLLSLHCLFLIIIPVYCLIELLNFRF